MKELFCTIWSIFQQIKLDEEEEERNLFSLNGVIYEINKLIWGKFFWV